MKVNGSTTIPMVREKPSMTMVVHILVSFSTTKSMGWEHFIKSMGISMKVALLMTCLKDRARTIQRLVKSTKEAGCATLSTVKACISGQIAISMTDIIKMGCGRVMDASLTTMESHTKVIGVVGSNTVKVSFSRRRVSWKAFGTMVNFRAKSDYYF
jgi:hypothetical protein